MFALTAVIAVAIPSQPGRGGEPDAGKVATSLKGIDLSGRLHRIGDSGDTKAVVAVFLSVHCPISNSYLPQLGELDRRYGRRGVELYGIVSDPSVTRAEAEEHSREYRIPFPVLFDSSGELRLAFSPTHTPHAFVLDADGATIYSGAIDDRYVELGKKKQTASRHFLADAVAAAVAGREVGVSSTDPIGCRLEDPHNKSQTGTVTYARDVAPIIQANCATCHQPNQTAPFPLLNYADVSSHANQILEVTQSRFMPPWKPSPGYGEFVEEARLSQHELSLLEAWVRSGKPKGDPEDLPPPVEPVQGWPLGEPDLVLQMDETFTVPASGPDIRQYFVIPSHVTKNRLIKAIDFQPGAPRAVHHASFFLDTRRAGRQLDEADPGPGYEGFGGPGFRSQGTLGSWFPGMTPHELPDGMGRLVPAGSDIVAEIHYVCTGKPERDRSKIGVYFARQSARQLVVELQVGSLQLEIPAGDKRHRELASYTLPVDTTLFDIVPHMHVLGQELKASAQLPDGTVKPLVWIKEWDFDWQGQYAYAEPVHLPEGTRITVEAWYDNSSENPLNPSSPPQTVYWGEDSTDEMLICQFQCTCETLEDLKTLLADQRRYVSQARGR